MRTRLAIAALIWPMIQGVLFGLGMLGLLALPLDAAAMLGSIWWMIAVTFLISTPIAWGMAPWLRMRDRPHQRKLTRPGA